MDPSTMIWYIVLLLLCSWKTLSSSDSSATDDLRRIPPPHETAQKFGRNFLGQADKPSLKRNKRQTSNYFDVVYIIDSSSSISDLEFGRGIRAIDLMISKSKATSKHSLITIATNAMLVLNFTSQENAVNKLRMLRRTGGKTNTQEALQVCHELFDKPENHGGRDKSFKRVLIVTDGQSNIKRNMTIPQAQKLKSKGIEVFIIAVGEYLEGIDELAKMASSLHAHMYRVEDMSGLVLVVKLIPRSIEQWQSNVFGREPDEDAKSRPSLLQET